jgi:hypothetical protein
MPWCPKCKSEYREGFTVCADCKVPLVEEEPVDDPEDDPKEAAFDAYPFEALDEEVSEQSGELPERKPSEEAFTAPYVDSSQRASDNRSSGWILLIIGSLGILFEILGVAGVLPVKFGNQYLFYGVMGAVFILFLVSGVMSIKSAKLFDKKAVSENTLRSTLHEWCRENLTAESVDEALDAEGEAEEILYFKRSSYIKEKLNHQFVNLDQGFLEQFVDETVYREIFESKGNT